MVAAREAEAVVVVVGCSERVARLVLRALPVARSSCARSLQLGRGDLALLLLPLRRSDDPQQAAVLMRMTQESRQQEERRRNLQLGSRRLLLHSRTEPRTRTNISKRNSRIVPTRNKQSAAPPPSLGCATAVATGTANESPSRLPLGAAVYFVATASGTVRRGELLPRGVVVAVAVAGPTKTRRRAMEVRVGALNP